MKNEVNRASRCRGAKKCKCKWLRIVERHLRNKRRKSQRSSVPLPYDVVSESPRILRLGNGDQQHQPIDGVDLYVSYSRCIYSLTRFGLRPICVSYRKKRNYCKRIMTGRGHHQGQAYPRVFFSGKNYPMLLYGSELITQTQYDELLNDARELYRIIAASLKTLKMGNDK